MRPDLLEAALELGAPKPEPRKLDWDTFIGHHRVTGFAYSARPSLRLVDGRHVPIGEDGLRLAAVEIHRPGSSWSHDRGVALLDGKQIVSVAAHGLLFTEPALRGLGYAGDVDTALYLSHPDLYLERRAAVYSVEGIKVVKRAFENLAELGAVVFK